MSAMLQPPGAPARLPRHRHALSREAVRESQSARILFATAAVVAERGYADTSVGAIVERAGVSRKTFYELFAGREQAFLAAYAAIDTVIERMVDAAGAHDEPRGMLRAGARAYLESLAEEPAFTHMLVIDAVGAGPRVLERRAQAFRDFVAVLSGPLELAREADPSLPKPDPAMMLAVLGGINELVLQHVVERDASTLTELAPAVETLIARVLLSPDAADLGAEPPLDP